MFQAPLSRGTTLLISGALLSLSTACYDAAECGFQSEAGACVSIVQIGPYDIDERQATSNVDAFRGVCVVPDPVQEGQWMYESEPFSDHLAKITISNKKPVDTLVDELAPLVTISQIKVTYYLNECGLTDADPPLPATCPKLDPIEAYNCDTVTIHAGETQEMIVPLMPLRKKFEYQNKGGDPDAIPSYTAVYDLLAVDADGEKWLEGTALDFTIGNFYCCDDI